MSDNLYDYATPNRWPPNLLYVNYMYVCSVVERKELINAFKIFVQAAIALGMFEIIKDQLGKS